ncbi:hypothetical protein [Nitrincola tapanii]|uniref:hypothetical protein n=1 Tax=Nitrincola tapanii TaxID=1708751 RepID=UPI001F207E4F|nr:hypothetical protein [Nitrincola tapanii]
MLSKKRTLWILVLLSVALIVWLLAPSWLQGFNQNRQEEAQAQREAGLLAGQTSDQQGCLDQALRAFDLCPDSNFVCTVAQGTFLKACWEMAAPSEGFCEGVPEFTEKPTEDAKEWARYTCWEKNIRGEGCRLLLRQQQQLCSASALPNS